MWKWLLAFFARFRKKPKAIMGIAVLSARNVGLTAEGQQDVYDVGNEDGR